MDDGVAELELYGNCSGSNLAHCKTGTFCDYQGKCSKYTSSVLYTTTASASMYKHCQQLIFLTSGLLAFVWATVGGGGSTYIV